MMTKNSETILTGEDRVLLNKLIQKLPQKEGIKIYIKSSNAKYVDFLIKREFFNPSVEIELEAAEKLFFTEKKSLFFSYNIKDEPDGAVSIMEMGYKITVSVAGFQKNSTNVFVSIVILSLLTQININTIFEIIGEKTSKISLESYEKEMNLLYSI